MLPNFKYPRLPGVLQMAYTVSRQQLSPYYPSVTPRTAAERAWYRLLYVVDKFSMQEILFMAGFSYVEIVLIVV